MIARETRFYSHGGVDYRGLMRAVDKYEHLKRLFDEINKADNHSIPLKQVSLSK